MLTSGGCLGLNFTGLLLNPSLLYAHETVTGQYTIYHNQPLYPAFEQRLTQARALVRPSEVFDSTLRLEGYAEYVTRRPGGPAALRQHLAYLQQAE